MKELNWSIYMYLTCNGSSFVLMSFFGKQTLGLRIDISIFDLFLKYNFKNMKICYTKLAVAWLSIGLNSSNLPTWRRRASVTMIILSLRRLCSSQTNQSRLSPSMTENAQINQLPKLTKYNSHWGKYCFLPILFMSGLNITSTLNTLF